MPAEFGEPRHRSARDDQAEKHNRARPDPRQGILGPILLAGFGFGLVFAAAFTAGTYGVEPHDAGVASATVSVGQQLGASVGTALLNTLFASAVASYLATDTSASSTSATLNELAQAHRYHRAFWWTSGIAVGGAVIAGALLRGDLLADPARTAPLDALREVYEVYPVVDAIGGTSVDAHHAGLERVALAGGQPISWVALACELQRDWSRLETVSDIVQIVITERLSKE